MSSSRRAVSADGEPAEVTQGTIDVLLASPDRTLRRTAWESYADGYLGVRNTLAANLAGTVKQAVFQSRVRRHESPLAASLSRSNVPVEVFDNLIATFEANLPTWHRYWRLRQKIHGVEQLAPYDLAAPLGASSPELEYEQCVEWICASLAPLGGDVRRHGQARLPRGALGRRATRPPGRWAAPSPPGRPEPRRSS